MPDFIYEITPFTTLDYPEKLACIVWFAGCNMRCIYCYNTEIVTGEPKISDEEFFKFLLKRQGKLDGVVFSGGECTKCEKFIEFASKVKELGYCLKVDTNGTNPKIIEESINKNLIDYIALDFKAKEKDYKLITNSALYDKFMQTLRYLIKINFDFEVRTTVHADFIDEKDIQIMSNVLEKEGYKGTYYLQNFLFTGENFGCIEKPLNTFNPKKIKSDLNIILRNF